MAGQWPTYINADANNEHLKVSDFITLGRCWDLHRLASLFNTEMMNHISCLSLARGVWSD